MSRDRPNEEQICPFSMAAPEPRFCPRAQCEAWDQRAQACSMVDTQRGISYQVFRIATFMGFESKKRAVYGLAREKRPRWKTQYRQDQEQSTNQPQEGEGHEDSGRDD